MPKNRIFPLIKRPTPLLDVLGASGEDATKNPGKQEAMTPLEKAKERYIERCVKSADKWADRMKQAFR